MGARIFQKIWTRRGAIGAGQRNLGAVDPAEAGRRVDHHHRPGGERHGDDARRVAEAEAQDEQRHQRQHWRRDEEQNVGRHHLLHEGELRDHRSHDQADARPDDETRNQLDEGVAEMGKDQVEIGDQGDSDLARLRKHVRRHFKDIEQYLGSADDHHGENDDRQNLGHRPDAGTGGKGRQVGDADILAVA